MAWNRTVNEIAFAEDQFFTFKGVRAHAMMHLAMHDALNAVIPLYRSFAYHGNDFFAHPIAAAAQAAHDVVVSQYPGEQSRLGAELATWLSQIPNSQLKTRGIALGQRSAAAILALRTGDGWILRARTTFPTNSEPIKRRRHGTVSYFNRGPGLHVPSVFPSQSGPISSATTSATQQ